MKKYLIAAFLTMICTVPPMTYAGEAETVSQKEQILFRAEQGDATAQYNLGVMYAYGQGVKQDDKQAAYWYQKAAEQDHAGAQAFLGAMYFNGQGVRQDYKKAVYWYQKAANQGLAVAQFLLGNMYAYGRGVSQNNIEAHKWFNLASANGHEGARKNRDLIAQKMTPAQLKKARQLARDWQKTP